MGFWKKGHEEDWGVRVLATFAAAFAAGIFAVHYGLPEAYRLPAALLFLLCAVPAAILHRHRGGRMLHRFLLILLGVAAALLYDGAYTRAVYGPAEALIGPEQQVTMTVCDYPAPAKRGAQVTVRLKGLRGSKAVLYGDTCLLDLVPGQRLSGKAQIRSAARIHEDEVTTFTSKGVSLLLYQQGWLEELEGNTNSPRWWPHRLGRAMQERIAGLFPEDAAGLLTALLTGDRRMLSPETASDLSQAGLFHIVAVSGLHCAFLVGLVSGLAGKHRRRLVAAVGIPLLLFYMILTGAAPSVVRACIMLIFLLLAPLFDRNRDSPTALAAALMLILLANPFAAAAVSLQLSFAAVTGLLWLTPRMRAFLLGDSDLPGPVRYLIISLSASCGALVFTVPLAAWYFGAVQLTAPIANLLCLDAVGVLFGSGMLAVAVSAVLPALGALLAWIPRLLCRYILGIAGFLAHLPDHAVYTKNPYIPMWLLFCYLLLFVLLVCRPAKRRTAGLAAVCAAAALVFSVQAGRAQLNGSALNAAIVDVGQGSCALLASQGTYAIVDCGSANSWYHPGESAADELLSMGCRSLDYLAVTHYDTDHISGIPALLHRLPVKCVLIPPGEDDAGNRQLVLDAAEAAGAEIVEIGERTALPFGRCTMTVFPPVGSEGDNERGLTFLTSAGEMDLLITGDMNENTERLLLERYPMKDVEVLVAGHHGSAFSTSEELLEALKPEVGIISVGNNAYGHPAPEVLNRLRKAGVHVCRTDMQGTIRLSIDEGEQHGIHEEEKGT